MRALKICIINIILCLALSVCSYAEEGKTQAEMIQEALLNGEMTPDTTTESAAESEPADVQSEPTSDKSSAEQLLSETVQTEDLVPADKLEERISGINQENPSASEVKLLRASYEALSIADKVSIDNLYLLEAAENVINGTPEVSVTPKPSYYEEKVEETPNQSQTKEFTFAISKDRPSLSITVQFVTDDNNDGKGDISDLLLTGPGGLSATLNTRVTEIDRDNMKFKCSWQENFMQIDIQQLPAGGWVIQSEIPMLFTRRAYMGGTTPIKPLPTEAPQENPNLQPAYVQYSGVLRLGLFLLLIVGGLVGVFVFTRTSIKKDGTINVPKLGFLDKIINMVIPKKPEKEEYKPDADSEDELIAQMRKEFEQQRKEREEAERQAAMAAEEDEANEDNRLEETQEEIIEEDDDMEMFSDHVGDTDLLAKKETHIAPKKKIGKRSFS